MTPLPKFAVFSKNEGSLGFYQRREVPKVGDVFEGKQVSSIYKIYDGWYWDKLTVPWYDEREYITNVKVVDVIKPLATKNWFYECYNLVKADLSKLDTSSVMYMDDMFYDCYKLVDINLSNFNTSTVRSMNGMFSGCNSLANLDLSSFNTSNVEDMGEMFYRCYNIKQVRLGDSFVWKGANAYLPQQSPDRIPGADGKWYAESDGIGYTSSNIPSNKADTYYASKDLLPNKSLTGSLFF